MSFGAQKTRIVSSRVISCGHTRDMRSFNSSVDALTHHHKSLTYVGVVENLQKVDCLHDEQFVQITHLFLLRSIPKYPVNSTE